MDGIRLFPFGKVLFSTANSLFQGVYWLLWFPSCSTFTCFIVFVALLLECRHEWVDVSMLLWCWLITTTALIIIINHHHKSSSSSSSSSSSYTSSMHPCIHHPSSITSPAFIKLFTKVLFNYPQQILKKSWWDAFLVTPWPPVMLPISWSCSASL